MRIKTYTQYNESFRSEIDTFKKEVNEKFKPIIDFAHEINDILSTYEDKGFDYELNYIYCDISDYEYWFELDLEKDQIEFDIDDIFRSETSFPPDMTPLQMIMNYINGNISLCIKTLDWGKEVLSNFKDRISSMYPFVKISWLTTECPLSITFKIGDLK